MTVRIFLIGLRMGVGFCDRSYLKSGGDIDTNKAFTETQGNEYTISYQFKTGDVARQPGFVLSNRQRYSTYRSLTSARRGH